MQFTVYVDESGEAGISKVRTGNQPGASPYFVLGAVVAQPTAEVHGKNAITSFKEEIGKSAWKHATELRHSEKVYLARELGRLPVRYFAVVSNKATLKEYKGRIDGNPQKFYNKCTKYLLECICTYLSPHLKDGSELRVVFEKRNHDYGKMIRFLQAVKEKPLYRQSKSLRLLNPFSITTKEKGEDEMLDAADFVAHAVFQCANRSRNNFGIPEPRYFVEMSSRFAGDKDGRLLGVGLKCIHSLEQVGLDADIERLIKSVRCKKPR